MQHDDPSAHAEVDAFRAAGRRRSYADTTIATTLAPCWYCSGLVRQFGIGTVVVGESRTFQGGIGWLRECGVRVIECDSQQCVDLLQSFIRFRPDIWNEDIGARGRRTCRAPGAAAAARTESPTMTATIAPE